MYPDLFYLFLLMVLVKYAISFDSVQLFDLNLVKQVEEYYHSKWIIIQTCQKTDYPVLRLAQEIWKSFNIYTSVYLWDDFLKTAEWEKYFNPLVLLSCWACPADCVLNMRTINSYGVISKFIWLAPENVTSVISTSNVLIPLDCQFITVNGKTDSSIMLLEVFRTSSDSEMLTNKFGHWNGRILNFTSTPFIERRSDFQGQNISTLVEPHNSLNRLIAIYNHYVPCYWDLANRLNFTVKNITDGQGAYEVSIYMHFTDVPSSNIYLQPLFSSWESLYFKDEGTGIKIDGYLKPFSKSVWLVIIPLILFTGFFSYMSSKVLHRITKNRTRMPQFHFYIYQGLYIFLQRHEPVEMYFSQKVIALSQWIVSMGIFSSYSAIFISFIYISIPTPPFRTVDGILEQGTHNIVAARHITAGILGILEDSTDVKLKMLYEKHFDPVRNVKDDPVRELCRRPNYIFLTSNLHMQRIRAEMSYEECSISQTKIKISIRHMSWSTIPNCQYRRFFRFYLNKLDLAGALGSHFYKQESYRNPVESNTFRGITFHDILSLLIVLLGGLLISIIILIIEMIHYHIISK